MTAEAQAAETYASTIDSIIQSSIDLQNSVNHFLDTVCVGDIDPARNSLIFGMSGMLLAHLKSLLCTILINISKNYGSRAGFRD